MQKDEIDLYEGKYPRVTDILKAAESRFFTEMRENGGKPLEKTMETARELGTKVHSLAEKIVATHGTAETVEVPSGLEEFGVAIRSFLNEYVEEIIATEQVLTGHVHVIDPTNGAVAEYGFGGRTDLIARLKPAHGGAVAVFDFKTSKSLSRENGLQLAAYKMAARQRGYPVEERYAVQIKKNGSIGTGTYYVRQYDDDVLDMACWSGIVAWYYWHKKKMFERIAKQREKNGDV